MRPLQLTLPSRQSLLHGTTENHKPERVQIIISTAVVLDNFSRRCIVEVAILRAHAMARPYSNDLRRKLLETFDQGKGSLSELAEGFGGKEANRADGEAQLSSWSQGPDR